MYEWGVAFDWITPLRHTFNILRGYRAFIGTKDEMDKLKARGVKVSSPFLDPATGEYCFQVPNSDYKRACKILGL